MSRTAPRREHARPSRLTAVASDAGERWALRRYWERDPLAAADLAYVLLARRWLASFAHNEAALAELSR